MAKWKQYTSKEIVNCDMCYAPIAEAKTGRCLLAGDGNGNYQLGCSECGWTNHYDIFRSKKQVNQYMSENESYFKDIRMINIRAFIKQGIDSFKQFLSVDPDLSKAEEKTGAFSSLSTASLITEEARKVKRKK